MGKRASKKNKEKVRSHETVFLKDVICGEDGILLNYHQNFGDKGKNILGKTATDERMINCNNLVFKTGDPVIKKFNLLKSFCTFFNFFIDLFDKIMHPFQATREQNEMVAKINELGNFVLLEEKIIKNKKTEGVMKKAKNKTQRNKIFAVQKSFLRNAIKLFGKRTIIIDTFVNKDIFLRHIIRLKN